MAETISLERPLNRPVLGRTSPVALVMALAVAVGVMAGLSENPWLLLAGCGCFAMLLCCARWPLAGLAMLVFVASFVDFRVINDVRLDLNGIPLNLVDAAAGLALFSAVVSMRSLPPLGPDLDRFRTTALHLLALAAVGGYGLVVGLAGNETYDVVRAARSFGLLGLSFVLTVYLVRRRQHGNILLALIVLGGILSVLATLVEVVPRLQGSTSFIEARPYGGMSASWDFVLTLPVAFAIAKSYLWRSRVITWLLYLLTIVPLLLSFKLTAYALIILMPAAALALSSRHPGEKFKLGLILLVGGLAVVGASAMVLAPLGFGMDVSVTLVGQVFEQLTNLSDSPNYVGRERTWMEVMNRFSGPDIFFGKGLGYLDYMDASDLGLGQVLVGEPTYSTYLLSVGSVGLAVLLMLQVRFVTLACSLERTIADPSLRSIMLACSIYGVLTILSGFLHNNFLSPQVSVLYAVLLGLLHRVESTRGEAFR